MAKKDYTRLEVIEEWVPIDPCDPQAIANEGQKLRFLISLILKAFERERLEQTRRADKENHSIRRKAGLAA